MNRIPTEVRSTLKERFEQRLKESAPLAALTTARVGGPAELLITIESAAELAETAQYLWNAEVPFMILGAGSNLLISEDGFSGVVLLNRAKTIRSMSESDLPQIWAESGANLGMLARKAALAGLSGLEWAATVPGTVGGAVYGNAGAHGSDIQSNLLLAEILQHSTGKAAWTVDEMQYAYRSSILKREKIQAVILSASFHCTPDNPAAIQQRMAGFSDYRRRTQPPGASMGSMFKNPPGDYAGRLIEAAGLKGTQIGGVKVSEVHANFFVNSEQATASDIRELIQLVQNRVAEKHGIQLELEVEPLGFNSDLQDNISTNNAERGKTL